MSDIPQQARASQQALLEHLTKVQVLLFEGFEQLAALNLKLAREGLEGVAKKALAATGDGARGSYALGSMLLTPDVEKLLSYSQKIAEVMSVTQTELTRLGEARVAQARDQFRGSIEAVIQTNSTPNSRVDSSAAPEPVVQAPQPVAPAPQPVAPIPQSIAPVPDEVMQQLDVKTPTPAATPVQPEPEVKIEIPRAAPIKQPVPAHKAAKTKTAPSVSTESSVEKRTSTKKTAAEMEVLSKMLSTAVNRKSATAVSGQAEAEFARAPVKVRRKKTK